MSGTELRKGLAGGQQLSECLVSQTIQANGEGSIPSIRSNLAVSTDSVNRHEDELEIFNMSWPLTDKERYALAYLYGGDRDVRIECHRAEWVTTRYSHKCFSVLHKGKATIPAGTRTIVERAKVDGDFRSYYTCEPCIKKAAEETY